MADNWIFLSGVSINLDQVSSIEHGTLVWDPIKCGVKWVTKKTERCRYFRLCGYLVREDNKGVIFKIIYKYLSAKGWQEKFDVEKYVGYTSCREEPYHHPTVVFGKK